MESIARSINDINLKEENGNISEVALKIDLQNLSLLEARKWRQLYKLKWLAEGDQNTTYFHKAVMAKKRFNFISKIQSVQRDNYYLDIDIENTFIDYFKGIYTENSKQSRLVGNLNWCSISFEQATFLINLFNEKEIQDRVSSLGSDKIPGPDGFTIDFFKKYWNIFKLDL